MDARSLAQFIRRYGQEHIFCATAALTEPMSRRAHDAAAPSERAPPSRSRTASACTRAPPCLLVQTASRFDAEVTVAKDGQSVNGRSIMGIMMLAAEQGSTHRRHDHAGRRRTRRSTRSASSSTRASTRPSRPRTAIAPRARLRRGLPRPSGRSAKVRRHAQGLRVHVRVGERRPSRQGLRPDLRRHPRRAARAGSRQPRRLRVAHQDRPRGGRRRDHQHAARSSSARSPRT